MFEPISRVRKFLINFHHSPELAQFACEADFDNLFLAPNLSNYHSELGFGAGEVGRRKKLGEVEARDNFLVLGRRRFRVLTGPDDEPTLLISHVSRDVLSQWKFQPAPTATAN